MASYWFRNTGSTSWNTATNWSLTDGGGATGAVPTASDDAFFSNNSGNCVVDVASRVCLTLDFTKGTGFVGSFTMTNTLTVSGNITLNGAMTFAGAAVLTINASSTITSNGITITSSVTCSGVSTTITLADNMRISGTTFQPSASATMVYAGAFTIYFSGTTFTSTNGFTSANTKIEFTGAVTLGSQQGIGFNEIRINTGSNAFTANNTINMGSAANTTTLTYVSGLISPNSANYMACIGNFVFDTYPIKWNFVDFNNSDATRTITINSPLRAKNIKVLGSSTTGSLVQTFAGSYGFECDNLNILYTTARTLTLSAGVTYKINAFIVSGATISAQVALTLNSSSSGVKAKILIDKYCQTIFQNVQITDVDNIGPNLVPIFSSPSITSSLTRSAGWLIVPNGQPYVEPSNIPVSY